MYVCSNCGKTFANAINFCDNCGSSVVAQEAPVQAIPTQPVQPQYSVPYTAPQPAGSRGKNIAGMVLGISGMVMALIGFLYALILLPEAVDRRYAAEILGTFSLVFFFLSAPLSIVGLALSNRKACGLVGTIFSGILFMLGIIFLGVAA